MNEKLELGDLEIDIFKMMHIDRSFAVLMVDHLKKEYFDSMILGKVFAIYKSFFEQYNKLPTRKIVENLTSSVGIDTSKTDIYFDQIFKPKEEIDINITEKVYLVEEVTKFAKRARMIEALNQSIDLIEKDDFETIISTMKDALVFNLDVKLGFDLYDIDESYKEIDESLIKKI